VFFDVVKRHPDVGMWQQQEYHSASPDEFEIQEEIVVTGSILNLSVDPLEQ
jgi:hypothetical protein